MSKIQAGWGFDSNRTPARSPPSRRGSGARSVRWCVWLIATLRSRVPEGPVQAQRVPALGRTVKRNRPKTAPKGHGPFASGPSLGDPVPMKAPVIALLGPTNTGKTHHALERLLEHRSGMIGFPLRLLARENYDRVV